MPNNAAVTVVKIMNLITGTREIWAHRLMTRAVEHPMIKRPPMISPQRTLLSSMNAASTSANGLRGTFGIGGGKSASSESFDHSPYGGAASREASSGPVGTTEGGVIWGSGAFAGGLGLVGWLGVVDGRSAFFGRPKGKSI